KNINQPIFGPTSKAAILSNATFVYPVKFYLSGFSDVPHVQYFLYLPVFCLYIYMTVLGNGLLLSVIYLVNTLHTPKYMIVFNLALTDLCWSTALIPKLLDTFLFDSRYIVYEACLSYMFFVWFFLGVQSWTLVIMAYDRCIAICFPLMYHSIVTKPAIVEMLLFVWVFISCLITCMVGFLNCLFFCGSVVIKSFFCDHGPTFHLACNDNSVNYITALVIITTVSFPPILIALTYICIAIALSRIASGQEGLKALKTCTSHLIIVAIFFLPVIATNMAVLRFSPPHQEGEGEPRIINPILAHTIPTLHNPIIYSLRTEETPALDGRPSASTGWGE
uniref:G-protein coupled receptors family 1 profile domain-containing protein n=1 Tax=Monopterus albus TaxID=43700 RepID=A0A3Q3J8I1_MONAL